jgi:hypothetical protein
VVIVQAEEVRLCVPCQNLEFYWGNVEKWEDFEQENDMI